MTRRLLHGIRPSKGGKVTAPMTLAAVFAALFMVLGAAHAAAHGDEPHADCIAGHISYAAAVKLAPSNDETFAAPQSVTFRLITPGPAPEPQETQFLPAKSRAPPLQ